jgi:hypothetical protein
MIYAVHLNILDGRALKAEFLVGLIVRVGA